MTFGGVDTYYDYEEHQWKFRRLGGGPVRNTPACPVASTPRSKEPALPDAASPDEHQAH